ncbi:MAG: hypothetical protein ACKODG_17500 [Betaproteobacteria bacterium]
MSKRYRFGTGSIDSARHPQSAQPLSEIGVQRALAIMVVLLAAVAGPASAQPASGAPAAAAPSQAAPLVPRGDEVVLNFRDAEIESVANAFGHLLGRNLVVDPRVRG